MSEKLPQDTQNEEVDLGQLFNAIGKLFKSLFNFIGNIFKGLFSVIIYAIKPFVVHFKIIAPIVVIAAILGYLYDKKFKDPVYYSKMVVKPHFDSKYKLSSNINYFNELIGFQKLTELSEVFEIDTLRAKELKGFELEMGPETQNDLFLEYDEYVKSVDTSVVDELNYIDFVNNREVLSANIFTVTARSSSDDIFVNLEQGFKKTFENEFSKRQKIKRDAVADIERQALLTQLARLDSIQKTYLTVLKNESEKSKLALNLEGAIPLQESKSNTKEYDLFKEEQRIRSMLSEIETEVAEENTYFDVLSGFDNVGRKDNSLKRRYSILLPLLLLGIVFLTFLSIKAFNFIKNYEG
ncbi:hypothetical protein [uncultured Winogradskyella sp.]|uniref:hypothetical protein n=1 Tax=uncultured Winogradskyella sp. TaxID=395353 RepID=UPI0026190208|nr:hypothetical protein [uncultured Winogradskyella sp.]